MTEEIRDLLRQGIVPIILGNDWAAHRLSARLYRTFGIPSVVCGTRRTVWDVFDPTCAFRRISLAVSSRLITEALMDLAVEYEDCFLLLIPLREEERALLREQASVLETAFVCRTPETLWNDPMLGEIRVP
jgi:hypothetical protein